MAVSQIIEALSGEKNILAQIGESNRQITALKLEIVALESRRDDAKLRIKSAQQVLSTLTGQPLPGDLTAATADAGSGSNSALITGVLVIVVMVVIFVKLFRKK
jgi:hypothetical protein